MTPESQIVERVSGVEPPSRSWQDRIITIILHPRHFDFYTLYTLNFLCAATRSRTGIFAFSEQRRDHLGYRGEKWAREESNL